MLLFFLLGINIGIMSTIVANKTKLDKLNAVLKQAKNLVQDLHEELEKNDLFIVKELSNEGFESRGANGISFLNHKPNASLTEYDERDSDYQKAEHSEAISQIEAEVEAELERLELNMKKSSLERISNYIELDPNFVVDVVQEDLPPLKVPRLTAGLSESDSDVNGIQTDYTHRANCGVSPKELSIRLHEVIHSRLEARIMELETALEDTQMRLHAMDSEHMISLNNLYVEKKSSSTQESPTFMDEGYDMEWTFHYKFVRGSSRYI
uniref:Ternary complex factor MIP1 leucine-zipper domain-containing protein n=1 Tax=Fagus sylvatica TaxID=28930 RepID=A0A2N9IE66_FAGSY